MKDLNYSGAVTWSAKPGGVVDGNVVGGGGEVEPHWGVDVLVGLVPDVPRVDLLPVDDGGLHGSRLEEGKRRRRWKRRGSRERSEGSSDEGEGVVESQDFAKRGAFSFWFDLLRNVALLVLIFRPLVVGSRISCGPTDGGKKIIKERRRVFY